MLRHLGGEPANLVVCPRPYHKRRSPRLHAVGVYQSRPERRGGSRTSSSNFDAHWCCGGDLGGRGAGTGLAGLQAVGHLWIMAHTQMVRATMVGLRSLRSSTA
jgi:hypothetical protein